MYPIANLLIGSFVFGLILGLVIRILRPTISRVIAAVIAGMAVALISFLFLVTVLSIYLGGIPLFPVLWRVLACGFAGALGSTLHRRKIGVTNE